MVDKKLVIKEGDAKAIKYMFEMYLLHKSTIAVANLLYDQGYHAYRRDAIHRMLKNPIYIGKVKHKTDIYQGQHEAIIDEATFNQVQEILKTKNIAKRSCLYKKNEVGILRGLLTCGCCNTSMTPANCQTRGIRCYYYTFTKARYYGHRYCHNGEQFPCLC